MLERERAKEEHRIKTEQAAEEVLRRQARVYIYIYIIQVSHSRS